MNEQMYCAKCGALLEENARFCAVCGSEVEYDRPEVTVNEKPKNIKGRSVGSVILSIIIAASVKTFLPDIIDKIDRNKAVKIVDEFAEKMESYKPIYQKDGKYISEHFGFEIDLGENWTVFEEEKLNEINDEVKNKMVLDITPETREILGDELVDKIEDVRYTEVEMGLNYMDGDYVAGSVVIMMQGNYGIGDNMTEKSFDEIKAEITSMSDMEEGEETIGDETWKCLKGKTGNGEVELVGYSYVNIKDDILCEIDLVALPEYEEEIRYKFLKSISSID